MKTQRKPLKHALILRNPQAAEAALKRCQKALDAVTFDKAAERARQAGKQRELRFAATAPVRKLIQQDKKAMRALTEASASRKIALEALQGRSLNVYSQTFGPFPSFSFDLTPGLHVFSPPYDLDRPGPTNGSPTDSKADRDTGDILADCALDSDTQGFRAASASVIIIFQPSVIGTLSVRPYTQYAQSWRVAGEYLSAHSEGHLTISVARDDNGQVLDSRDITLFNQTTESDDNSDDDDGVAYPPDFQVNFLAQPGINYLVAITASVSGDQSGVKGVGPFPSWSLFSGTISASVPWLVAELRP